MSLLERGRLLRFADHVLVNEGDVNLRIIPDRSVRPFNVESLTRSLHELYLPPIRRVESWKPLRYRTQESFTFTTRLAEDVTFFLTAPQRWAGYVRGKFALCYPGAAIIERDRKHHGYFV